MNVFKRICVFCGSSFGSSESYKKNVKQLGALLAKNDIELVYGGGNSGLMGVLAHAVMTNNGKATGIIPHKINDRVQHLELTDLIVVDTMHERKAKMYELADAFIALPGGIGTMEEMFEVMTWNQLGYHTKPLGLFNIEHYYDPLYELLTHMHSEGFVQKEHLEQTIIEDQADQLLQQLEKLEMKAFDKWT
ncbi:TIGR00730 family Rossman fold protein [Alkalihalobacillus sp. AL-G]|uniref:LOG family protein n=1 Tax=Alkalihalobacillus sp. AL-G TaxID=2926399 RepID=UPI00272D89E0|nr:TIGR00730 family Rossman fold protein [Alkalihalobacillus sp. AL-G]WLD94742.1 TIGR00730 family Rossman fold protein [Alkalihalobacillus sp. AL-G]